FGLYHAVDSLLDGGRQLQFDYALIFAGVSLAVEFTAATVLKAANRRIGSEFLALDVKSWQMSAWITMAYIVAFGFGLAAQGSSLEWLTPYIDPLALGVVCAAVLPMPLGTVRRALADILLVTPADLKQHVDEVAQASVQRYGFASYRANVARVGRNRQIELYFLVSSERPARALVEWDNIRDEISEAIGADTPDRWLMIVCTTAAEWAGCAAGRPGLRACPAVRYNATAPTTPWVWASSPGATACAPAAVTAPAKGNSPGAGACRRRHPYRR